VGFDSVMRKLLPREEGFREIFGRNTENLVAAARLFATFARADSLEARRVQALELKAVEHRGDQITRELFEALNTTFITPFDREDIRSMGTDLDDILDYLEGVAQHLVLFELGDSPLGLQQFADILLELVQEVHKISGLVWDLSKGRTIRESMVRISDLENRADALYNTVIADLFKSRGRDPLEVMKWKEVYEGLEDACDACKDFGHVIGNIVTKNT
jgi:predicted phosphate transport protein (TIGR00153 family)